MTREEAQAILALGKKPIFKIEDVAEAVGVAPTTIRNWISRGHIELLHTRLFGRGNRAYFAYYDVILIMIAAELSHLGIKPMDIRGSALAQIDSFVSQKIGEAAGVWGDPQPYYENLKRYIGLFYTGDQSQPIDCYAINSLNDIPQNGHIVDVTRIVIDCKTLADKAIDIFKKLPRYE